MTLNRLLLIVGYALLVEYAIAELAIRQHATQACAEAHVRYHRALLMPSEGGEYAPYNCTDQKCILAYA